MAGIFLFNSKSTTSRIIIIYIWCSTILDVLAFILGYNFLNNLFLFHIHTYVEFFFLVILFKNLIGSKGKSAVLNLLSLVFILASLVLLLSHQGVMEFNSVQRHLEGVIITFIISFYLYERSLLNSRVYYSPMVVLSWVLLLYFNGNLLVFAFGDQILTSGNGELWIIHGILNIILNLSFTYVILSNPKYSRGI